MRFTRQAFGDGFDQIQLGSLDAVDGVDDDFDRAQELLPGLWRAWQRMGPRVLSYDATNFYPFIASTNDVNDHLKV